MIITIPKPDREIPSILTGTDALRGHLGNEQATRTFEGDIKDEPQPDPFLVKLAAEAGRVIYPVVYTFHEKGDPSGTGTTRAGVNTTETGGYKVMESWACACSQLEEMKRKDRRAVTRHMPWTLPEGHIGDELWSLVAAFIPREMIERHEPGQIGSMAVFFSRKGWENRYGTAQSMITVLQRSALMMTGEGQAAH